MFNIHNNATLFFNIINNNDIDMYLQIFNNKYKRLSFWQSVFTNTNIISIIVK